MVSVAKSDLPRVVLLGGGNGTSVLLKALLPLLKEKKIASLHALVNMSDDGGSTGRLRKQYGVAPMGDLTKCLMALSGFRGDIRGEEFLQALDYRFDGGDFAGHTLRNVFLTSLTKTSDLDAALAMMARLLQVPKYAGVVPTTLTSITQQVEVVVGNRRSLLGEGQHTIAHRVNMQADPRWQPGAVRVRFAEKEVELNPRARRVLDRATHIIVAPGHTYGTILPTLALLELGEAVAKSKAWLGVVMTLLTTPRQTAGWKGEDFVRVYESYLGKKFDVVVANTEPEEVKLVAGQDWVRFQNRRHDYNLIEENVVSSERQKAQAGDVVPRAVVVHDPVKLEKIFRSLLKK
ncbi:MAG: 2-phospho-L-lactate transferase CofD family protein [bacterium]